MPSKVSLASTRMLTAVSSLVVAVSSTMSATAIDRHAHGRGLGDAARGHRVGEAVGAVEIRGRRIDHEIVGRIAGRAVVVDGDGAVRPVGGAGDRRRAVERVVRQNVDVDCVSSLVVAVSSAAANEYQVPPHSESGRCRDPHFLGCVKQSKSRRRCR